ncbi:MAG: hypothetical protein AABX07_02225 [Nanoarchaeota archaeon]
MQLKKELKKFWAFLQKDSWQSWIVSIILIIVLVRGIFFPILSFATGANLPLVVVESCSMYHETNFEQWWEKNSQWYEPKGIDKEKFKSFILKGGLNKGDIILVWGKSDYRIGDILIFNAQTKHPLIHRIVSETPLSTKGDHNSEQLTKENNAQGINEINIDKQTIIGKAVGKIPLLGWVKLIFFEPFRPSSERGFCH